MKSKREIKEILDRINEGRASPEDRKLLQKWYNSWDDSETTIKEEQTEEELKEQIWQGIHRRRKPIRLRWKKYYAVAAAGILLFTASMILIRIGYVEKKPLMLSSGIRIEGVDNEVKDIAGQLETFLDTVSYVDMNTLSNSTRMARVSTQKGQFAKIRLPDGTKVSLNADTKLRLSPDFENSAQRTVELEGEAYFDVTTLPHRSFVVKTREQEIHVLGTKFNVKAYSNQKNIVTSLVEGKIRLIDHGKVQVLKPNQKAINMIGTEELVIKEQDLSIEQGWRKLNFEFDNEPVEEVLLQLGRWYGLEVVFDSAIPEQSISGKIERGTSLTDLQTILGNLTKAQYRMKENILYVNFKK